ncbi:zinc-dependent alcohol dehydrogenase [Treponema primitia]|uniref:zinc-dependent alcohol dehydrogenase n=1 Tax=Treponema primitia TaxID=88058 RepID=UPI0002555401|nr:alcohol dehydrogenase catalytic domain-containing protein [Treponema primitia]
MKSVQVIKAGPLRDPTAPNAGELRVVDIPVKAPGPEEIKIKVAYCSICGSDPHIAQDNIFGWDLPFGIGHEVSGVIVEMGERATKKGLKVGDHVAGNFLKFCGTCYYCQNGQQQFCTHADESNQPGMSEYITWHESQVYKLPEGVSLKEGCLLEPISVAVRIVDKVSPRFGARIAICGGGPIGLLALQGFKIAGASQITLIEPIADRRALALKFGAKDVIDPTVQDVVTAAMGLTGGLGYDAVVDCSGSVRAVGSLPQITALGGTLLFSAMYPNTFEFPLNLYQYCYKNEITISGIYISPYTFPRAAQLLPLYKLEDFTRGIFDIDDVAEAFRQQVAGKYTKILIRCNNIDE